MCGPVLAHVVIEVFVTVTEIAGAARETDAAATWNAAR